MAALTDSLARNRAAFDPAAAGTDTSGAFSNNIPPVKKEKTAQRSLVTWMSAGAFVLILLFAAGRRKNKGQG